jgi:hypothetical protein
VKLKYHTLYAWRLSGAKCTYNVHVIKRLTCARIYVYDFELDYHSVIIDVGEIAIDLL